MRSSLRTALAGALFLAASAGIARVGRAAPDAVPPDPRAKALATALDIESELIGSLEKVRRSSVSVLHLKRIGQPAAGETSAPLVMVGVGSGVLVQEKGSLWVITNVHVVQGADEIAIVSSDGGRHAVTVVDRLEKYDFALLGFPNGTPKGLKGVPVPRGAPNCEEGNWVLATGNPFFLANDGQCVATLGVVSGRDRILGGQFLYGKALQHDAEINRGNSGGPLWNLKGQLIGINGMISTRGSGGDGSEPTNTGASFAIPIQQVAQFLGNMIDQKVQAKAGTLGVKFVTWTDKDGSPAGARVVEVQKAVAKGKDEIKAGDVIVKIAAKGKTEAIRTASDLVNALSMLPADTPVRVTYRRNKSLFTWAGNLGSQ